MSTKSTKSRLGFYIAITFVIAIGVYVAILALNGFDPHTTEIGFEKARPALFIWRIFLYGGIAGLYYYVRNRNKQNDDEDAVNYLDSVRNYGLILVGIIELPALLRLVGIMP